MVLTMARPTRFPGRPSEYARKVVPADVRGALGRVEFKKALEGDTVAERREHFRTLMDEWEGQIEAARATAAGILRPLSHRKIQSLCGKWYQQQVAIWEDEPGAAAGWVLYRDHLADRVSDHEHDEPAPPFEPNRLELTEATRMLTAWGIAADPNSIRRFAVALWETKFELGRLMERRADGDYSPYHAALRFPPPTPAPAAVQAAPAGPVPLSLDTLLAAWAGGATHRR